MTQPIRSRRRRWIALVVAAVVLALVAATAWLWYWRLCGRCGQPNLSISMLREQALVRCLDREIAVYRTRREAWERPVPADVDDQVWRGVLACGR